MRFDTRWLTSKVGPALLLCAGLIASRTCHASQPAAARWIWSTADDRDAACSVTLQRPITLDQRPERATLRAAADFASLQIRVAGQLVGRLDAYQRAVEFDITRLLGGGEPQIEVVADGVPGPSAVALSLQLTFADAADMIVPSDDQWTAGGESVVDLGPVEYGRLRQDQLPDITPFAEYNQWKEALRADDGQADAGGARLSPLPPGFEITKLRDAAEDEDSWISLTFDPQGRLIIGKEQQGLLRLTLSRDGNRVVAAETIEKTLAECRGLVWHDGALYAHANRDKTLFRLRDTDGDGQLDDVQEVVASEGGTGHGRNALTVGPDGEIHGIVGDDVLVPHKAPRRAPPETSAPHELGHWVRLAEDHDGRLTWQAMNRGLRNPYGIDFGPDGEPFTYDADNEGDVGLPFYRPTRINHLVSGANYGWHQARDNRRSLPAYAPESLPTTVDLGRGSPTGVRFATASGWPSPWGDSLLVLDWAYGRIIAVELLPQGASYFGAARLFLEGRPLNVTDLDFDADGTLWFVTGGRKTASSLYRVRYVGESSDQRASQGHHDGQQRQARAEFSAGVRQLRRSLEQFHGHQDEAAVQRVWPHLGSPDPWLRGAARVALEWQPPQQWREPALQAPADLGGLTARLALVRRGNDQDRQAVARWACRLDPNQFAVPQQLLLLRLYDFIALEDWPPPFRQRVAAQLLALVDQDQEPIRREVARLLVAAGAAEAVDFALQQMAEAEAQPERLHYLEVLADASVGWTPQQHRAYFTALAYAKRYSYGDRFMPPFFEAIEQSALAAIGDDDQRQRMAALLEHAIEPQEMPNQPRDFVRRWTVDELASHGGNSNGGDGDPQRGQQLFRAVGCAKCHVCGSLGRPLGPDLTTVARRFGRRDLLESIIEPSKVVAQTYRNLVVVRDDGHIVTGRLVQNDFRQSKLVLAAGDAASPELIEIPKDQIESWSESPISPMPDGLLDTLTRAQVEDLLAFLLGD